MSAPIDCSAEPPGGDDKPPTRCWPLRALADGRVPVITSGFREVGRRDHQGCDLLYVYKLKDPWVKPGDGGVVVRRGLRRWWIPGGTEAVCTEDGEIVRAGKIGTGWRVWVFHPASGVSTGYFHLRELFRDKGDVPVGSPLGLVGDNPAAHDAVHLHFETMLGRRFVTPLPRINPRDYLERAEVLSYIL